MRKLVVGALLSLCFSAAWSQKYPVRPQLSDKESFSMVVIPDPQSYVKNDANQPLFELQTAWIANSLKSLKIKTVLCTGDLVDRNEVRIADGGGNQTSEEQWKSTSRAFERLDGKVPYVVCTGNHDYGYRAAENRNSHFHEYFPAERNSCWKETLVSVGNNAFGVPTLENAAYEFKTKTWGKLLVVSLEFAPRDEAIAWAKKLINSEKYANHRVIILTHSFLSHKGERFQTEGYKLTPANYAQAVWDKLLDDSQNIFLLVCGHACAIVNGYDEQVAFRTDANKHGKKIHQMMFNAQTADGQWHGNGGDCWLRLLEFKPDVKTISVRTFSPLFALSPVTKDKAWRTESWDQFEFVVE